MAPSSFTVVQLSDIHWGAGPSPIDGRDPLVTFGHVRDHLEATFKDRAVASVSMGYQIGVTPLPAAQDVHLLREEIDPQGLYL